MRFTYFHIFIILTFSAGCSSSREEVVNKPPPPPQEIITQDATAEQEAETTLPPSAEPLLEARRWSPLFIKTGFASGIMVEFTGLKENAKLNARYAGIELQRVTPDTLFPSTFNLTSTINDLRQAFFKVRPGWYLLRQTRLWAEQTYIRDVEVREGNYSVVRIEVFNPRAPKLQPVSETNENK